MIFKMERMNEIQGMDVSSKKSNSKGGDWSDQQSQCMVNLFWENVTLSIYTVKNYRSTQNGILIFSKHFSSWESSITDHRFWVRVLRPHSRFLQLRNCGQVTSLYLSFLIYKMYFLHKAVIGINCTSICDVFKGSGRQPEHLSVVWYRDLKCLCKKFL